MCPRFIVLSWCIFWSHCVTLTHTLLLSLPEFLLKRGLCVSVQLRSKKTKNKNFVIFIVFFLISLYLSETHLVFLVSQQAFSLIPNWLSVHLSKTFHLSVFSVGSDPLCCYSYKGSVLVCWCVHVSLSLTLSLSLSLCASHCRGLSARFLFFPQNFGLGFVIQGWTVDPEEDRGGEKECKGEEWATDGEKVGCTPVSIESLFRVFEVRGWGFRGKQDYSESEPLNNPGVPATAMKHSRVNRCGFAVQLTPVALPVYKSLVYSNVVLCTVYCNDCGQ